LPANTRPVVSSNAAIKRFISPPNAVPVLRRIIHNKHYGSASAFRLAAVQKQAARFV
jgi:hypothetical protein